MVDAEADDACAIRGFSFVTFVISLAKTSQSLRLVSS
jgi:hypothetical protein